MIHYVAVHGEPAAVARIRPRLPAALAETRLFDGELAEHGASDGTWALAALEAPDPTGQARLVIDGGRAMAINGPAQVADGSGAPLLPGTLAAWGHGGVGAVTEHLRGPYNLVALSSELGLEAFGDFSGMFPLYWRQVDGAVVVSMRSTTVARAVGPLEWDLEALAWMMGHAELFGDAMPAKGVRYLVPGTVLGAGPGPGTAVVRAVPDPVWPQGTESREDLDDDEWDAITADLVANLSALAAVGVPMRLRLSGGKDSRLVLALAHAAGLIDQFQAVTQGPPNGGEAEVAAAVAAAVGMPHRATGTPLPLEPPRRRWFERKRPANPVQPEPSQLPYDPDPVWRRLRQHAYRHEAIVSPWDGHTDPIRKFSADVSGFGGELYRIHAKRIRETNPQTVEALAELFVDYNQPHDPLGVLRPGVSHAQDTWLTEWVAATAEHVRLEIVPDTFYVNYHFGHWNGPLGQNTPPTIALNPLVSRRSVNLALQLSARARASDLVHYEVMRRTAPQLVTIPFLNDRWPDLIAERSPVPLPLEPYPVSSTIHPKWSRWQAQFLTHEAGTIDRLLADADAYTSFGDICDLAALRRELPTIGASKRGPASKQVLSAICIALTLLGRAEPFVDAPPRPALDA